MRTIHFGEIDTLSANCDWHMMNAGRPDAKPVLYLPPPRQCPPITSHYISLCELACQQAHGDGCPGAKCKMFGAMPSDFMVFEVNEQPQVEEDDDQAATLDVNASKWDVNHRWGYADRNWHFPQVRTGRYESDAAAVVFAHVGCNDSGKT